MLAAYVNELFCISYTFPLLKCIGGLCNFLDTGNLWMEGFGYTESVVQSTAWIHPDDKVSPFVYLSIAIKQTTLSMNNTMQNNHFDNMLCC